MCPAFKISLNGPTLSGQHYFPLPSSSERFLITTYTYVDYVTACKNRSPTPVGGKRQEDRMLPNGTYESTYGEFLKDNKIQAIS